jgi:hypothetical protein
MADDQCPVTWPHIGRKRPEGHVMHECTLKGNKAHDEHACWCGAVGIEQYDGTIIEDTDE